MTPLNDQDLTKQKLSLTNDTGTPLSVRVEMTPEWYVLQPGDQLTLIADTEGAPRLEGYEVSVQDWTGRTSIVIHAAWNFQPSAFINGVPAESDDSESA